MLDSLEQLECLLRSDQCCHKLNSVNYKADLGQTELLNDGLKDLFECLMWASLTSEVVVT